MSLKVPGQKINDPNRSLNLILGSIYILLGLAVIAMCFNLVQEQLTASFLWLGKKIGLIRRENKIHLGQKKKKKFIKNSKVSPITNTTKKNLEKKVAFYLNSIN